MKRAALQPRNPERICWGCDKYCAPDELACGNGTIRTPHPVELFGEDWLAWSEELQTVVAATAPDLPVECDDVPEQQRIHDE